MSQTGHSVMWNSPTIAYISQNPRKWKFALVETALCEDQVTVWDLISRDLTFFRSKESKHVPFSEMSNSHDKLSMHGMRGRRRKSRKIVGTQLDQGVPHQGRQIRIFGAFQQIYKIMQKLSNNSISVTYVHDNHCVFKSKTV